MYVQDQSDPGQSEDLREVPHNKGERIEIPMSKIKKAKGEKENVLKTIKLKMK